MTSETRRQFVGQENVYEPAGRFNTVCTENYSSEYVINAILYFVKAEPNLSAVPAKGTQDFTEDLSCFKINRNQQPRKSMGAKSNLNCHVASAASESIVISPSCHGEVNHVVCDDKPVQYCAKPKCECMKPELYNTHRISICDNNELTSSYQEDTTSPSRCAHVENYKFQNDVSTRDVCHVSKKVIRHHHSWRKLTSNRLLLTLILQACLYFAVAKDVPVIQPATYQPCLLAQSSSHLIYERHPHDCTIFYMCHGSRSWPMTCTKENTVFSLKHKVCVWKNSDFDDCQNNFSNVKKSSLRENNLHSLTENREKNDQDQVGGSLTDTFLHENQNGKNRNGLKMLESQSRVKQVVENVVNKSYNPSQIKSHDDSTPIYLGKRLFPVSQNGVTNELQTQEHISGSDHHSLILGSNRKTGKSRNYDTKSTIKHTDLEQTVENLHLVDSKKYVQTGQETMHENKNLNEEMYFDNASKEEEIEEEHDHNTHDTSNHILVVDKTGWTTNSFDNNNIIKTTPHTSITDERMDSKERDSFDNVYRVDSSTHLPFNKEHSERTTETSSEEQSTESSYYDEYVKRTTKHTINSDDSEQATSIMNERNTERTIKSPSFDTSVERTHEFKSVYNKEIRIVNFFRNEDNVVTTLSSDTDENTSTTPLSPIGGYINYIKPLSSVDEYSDITTAPSRAKEDLDITTAPSSDKEDLDITTAKSIDNEDLDQLAGTRDEHGYPYHDRDFGDKRESMGNRKMPMGETNEQTPTSFDHVQTILKKGHHLQDTSENGNERSQRATSYGQVVSEPVHIGKSWLKRPLNKQKAQERDSNSEQNISKDRAVRLLYGQKNHSNKLQFQDRTIEKHFGKEHFSNANENYGKRETLQWDGTIDEKSFSEGSQNMRESNLDKPSLLRKKEDKNVLHKSLLIGSYNDKQSHQKKDDKANRVWYVRNSGLLTQNTEDKKHRVLNTDLTRSTKTKFVDNTRVSKSHLTVQPWQQLTRQQHNKQTRKSSAINNFQLMEKFLRMLNITVHRKDIQVKDVQSTSAPTLRFPGEDMNIVSTIISKQSWTTERPTQSNNHIVTHLPSWNLFEHDVHFPNNQKDNTLKRFIPKIKHYDQESNTNNERFLDDREHRRGTFEEGTKHGGLPSQNEHIQKHPLVQRQPQENQYQQNQQERNQHQQHQKERNQHQQNQYQQNENKHNQYQKNKYHQNRHQQNQYQHNRYQQNQQERNQHKQKQPQHNQNKHNQYQQNQYQQNKYQQNQYQQNQQERNQHQQNLYQDNQYQQNQYKQNQNEHQQNQHQYNHYQHNQFQQNRYPQNQYQYKKVQLERQGRLQNKTLTRIIRKDANEKQKRTNVRQNSAPQLWEVNIDRPWFEKLLNKNQITIGQKKKFDHTNYRDDQNVSQLEKVKRSGIRISDQRQNNNLDQFRQQRNLDIDQNDKHDLKDSKMEQNVRHGLNSKRIDKNINDNDLKLNIILNQKENLLKHKQLLLEVRNKTSKKLVKTKMDQISNFYTADDFESESSDYEETDFSFMAQPVPVYPLPRPTKASSPPPATTTTTIATSQTTTRRDEDTKPTPSYDLGHVPAYRKELKERCGIMATPLIIGGQRSRRGQWPWQASLQIVTSTTPWHRCGGVLVHPKWVLTAAHCMEGSFYGEISNWRVALADYNLETVSGNEIYRDIVRVISHPGYVRTSNFPNDVALLELDSPVDMTSGDVQTACMPDWDFPLVPGMKCWISGWGETRGTGGQENIMNEVSVDVLPHDQCKSMWGKVNIDVLDSQVCLGYGQTGACYGDSGGPLMCESQGRFFVAGVMSWLINNCSANNFPNVFTRLPNYTDWLYKELDYFEWMQYL